MVTRVSQSGPWRLAMASSRPCPAGRKCRRRGAVLGCRSATDGRRRKNRAPLSRAARCRRRRAGGGTRAAQHSRIARLSCFRICSAAHSASSVEPGVTHSSRRQSSRQLVQQWMQGSPGGWTSAMRRSARRLRAGRSRLTSPMPGWSQASSMRDPSGQPWPGSSESRCGKPVETVAWCSACRLAARQSAGCMRSGCIGGRASRGSMVGAEVVGVSAWP